MSTLNKKRHLLLIVEDEHTDALLLRKALKSHIPNARVEFASSGADALTYLNSCASKTDVNHDEIPRLILMDLKLPGISGFELLEKVKSTERINEIPIVILTSSSDSKDVQRAYAAGANSYLVKPNTFSGSLALTGKIVHYWLALDQRTAGRPDRPETSQDAA